MSRRNPTRRPRACRRWPAHGGSSAAWSRSWSCRCCSRRRRSAGRPRGPPPRPARWASRCSSRTWRWPPRRATASPREPFRYPAAPMASREEEKRKRREEREAAEAAHAAGQTRARRLQFLLGALLTIAVVVVVVIVVSGSGGGGDKTATTSKTPSSNTKGAKVPPLSEANLDAAAKAAGCVLLNPPIEGSSHVDTKVKYKSNPPTSGNHNPVPALDGIYDPGQEPTPEHTVHALEHGRIDVQYAKGTPKAEISQLETVVSEELNGKDGYKTLLFQNQTNMPSAVAAPAWGHLVGCKTFSDKVFAAIRAFRVKSVKRAPEPGPPPTN